MVWNYIAVNELAHEVKGMECGTFHDVSARLKAQGLCLVSLDVDMVQSLKNMMSAGKLPSERLAFFFRDFSNMLGAGLALDHVLMTFRDSALDGRVVVVCMQMSESLEAGASLAQAMESSQSFPRLAVQVAGAGERAGNMPLVMALLADHFQLIGELKGKVLSALVYPSCILIFLLAALVYVAQHVVPQLVPLLPPDAMNSCLTRVMLGLSQAVRLGWGFMLAGVIAIVVISATAARRDPKTFDGILSRVPLIGALRKDLEIALCFFDLFVRLKSGIPLDLALGEVAADAPNATGMRLDMCRQYLSGGHTFSGALSETGYFPRVVSETIRLGEEMGCYDGYCERVFKLYYRSFETRVGLLTSVFQPAVLVVCALFVAAMAFAFLQPIYGNLTHIGALNP